MTPALETLLKASEDELLVRWVERVRGARLVGLDPTGEDVSEVLRESFRDIVRSIDSGDAKAAIPAAARMNQVVFRRGGRQPAQTETLLALALGRDVLLELVAERLAPTDAAASNAALTETFQRLLTLYGQAACSNCMAAQDETRARIERRLGTVIDHSLDAMVLCDARGAVEAWNRGAEALLGWSAEEAIGRPLDFLAPLGRPRGWFAEIAARVQVAGHARIPETELARKGGDRVWVDGSYTRVRDPGGPDLGIWAVFRDITEQRRLVEENLQADRLALIGTMSAKFAHEIRNPLASILLNVELIRDALAARAPGPGETPGEDQEIVGSIASEVGRIQNVVQEYLRFARLPKAQRSAVDLDAVLRRGLGVLAPEFKQRDIALDLALDAGGCTVLADGDQVWQVVLNLVRNAMEALPHGGRISVTTRKVAGGVECAVADDGPGIPADVRERMFTPFFSTKRSGTGLGLPFVRQVIREHETTLELDSMPARGTRFAFVLSHAVAD
ncbi:MAG: ATP-binding protein [Candidatus Eisenbacteria bacterium]